MVLGLVAALLTAQPVFEWAHAVSYSHVTDPCRTQCTYADTTHLAPSAASAGCGTSDAGTHAAIDARTSDVVASSDDASALATDAAPDGAGPVNPPPQR